MPQNTFDDKSALVQVMAIDKSALVQVMAIDKSALVQVLAIDKSALVQVMAIRTLHGCPSQMNKNLMISNSKLASDFELIW